MFKPPPHSPSPTEHRRSQSATKGGSMAIPKYTYGWLDKLTSLTLPDGGKAIHTYWPDGLLASISRSSQSPIPDPQSPSESFPWDGPP